MQRKLFFMLLMLVSLPLFNVEAARVTPMDLYPSQVDLWSSIFLLPQVKAVLLTIIILGILAEIKTAGTGIAGSIAVVCAVALFGINFMSGNGGWQEILLFVVGLGLLVLEVFIPGFGVFGVIGMLSLLGSFYYLLGGNAAALNWLAVSLVAAIGIFALLVKYLPSNPAWNLVVLKERQMLKEGLGTPDFSAYLGASGITVTVLRPSGIALVEGKRLDVITSGEYIATGTSVKVVKIEGNKIFVSIQQ
ncbi:MAG: NfeD family protein [Acidaminococcaceae bacterium]